MRENEKRALAEIRIVKVADVQSKWKGVFEQCQPCSSVCLTNDGTRTDGSLTASDLDEPSGFTGFGCNECNRLLMSASNLRQSVRCVNHCLNRVGTVLALALARALQVSDRHGPTCCTVSRRRSTW